MKILFVCKGNVIRSQMAEAFYNKKNTQVPAFSAGTEATEYENKFLENYAFSTVSCMQEIEYDISSKKAKQLTHEMINSADRVIVMAEKETWPSYLQKSSKVEM